MKRAPSQSTSRSWYCGICHEIFGSTRALQAHKGNSQTHAEKAGLPPPATFPCVSCGTSFSRTANLTRHVADGQCQKSSATKRKLVNNADSPDPKRSRVTDAGIWSPYSCTLSQSTPAETVVAHIPQPTMASTSNAIDLPEYHGSEVDDMSPDGFGSVPTTRAAAGRVAEVHTTQSRRISTAMAPHVPSPPYQPIQTQRHQTEYESGAILHNHVSQPPDTSSQRNSSSNVAISVSTTLCRTIRREGGETDLGNLTALSFDTGQFVQVFDLQPTDYWSLGRLTIGVHSIGLFHTSSVVPHRHSEGPDVALLDLAHELSRERPVVGAVMMDLWEHWGFRWPYTTWEHAVQGVNQRRALETALAKEAQFSGNVSKVDGTTSITTASMLGASASNTLAAGVRFTVAAARSSRGSTLPVQSTELFRESARDSESATSLETRFSAMSLFGKGSNKSFRFSLTNSDHSTAASFRTMGSASTRSDGEMPAPFVLPMDSELRNARGLGQKAPTHRKRKVLGANLDKDMLPGHSGSSRVDILAKMAEVYSIETDSDWTHLSTLHGPRIRLLPDFEKYGILSGFHAGDQLGVIGYTAAVRKWICRAHGEEMIFVSCRASEPVLDPLALIMPLASPMLPV